MICVSIIEQDIDKCIEILKQCEMAELRLDKIQPGIPELKKLLAFDIPIIATCRAGIYDNDKRLELLTAAIKNGAGYVDIELESDENYRKMLINAADYYNCKIIISYHNFNETPDIDTLKNIVARAKALNPDLIKIVTYAQTADDNSTVLSLYQNESQIVAFAMGESGKESRIRSLMLGSPFIYAACEKGCESAAGQMTVDELKKILKQ
ncbi:MAG: type I 3-dehydroquinate dehydratase [Prevotellaceae bacterium]|jgi:3-dehydroquinate dehydratase-1|nr:type I 3-dehydroquinate dehydratase [Prevotellaceae bacterium]